MAVFTIPANNKVAGVSTGLTADLDLLYFATLQLAEVNVQNSAYAGGADPTGVAACDTALAAAYTALGGASGVIRVPPGTYSITSGWTLALPDAQTCIVACEPGVQFNYSGTGDCIRMYNTPGTTAKSRGSGIIGNPVIDGSASTGTSGVHVGDIFQLKLFVTVQLFTSAGAKGVWFDNHIAYTEQMEARIVSNRNTNAVVFDVTDDGVTKTSTGSYARPKLDLAVQTTSATGSSFNGVVCQNGAAPYDGMITIRGNFPSTTGTAGAVVQLTGTIPAGHPNAGSFSKLSTSRIDIGVESTTTNANVPQTINFGAAGNQWRDNYGNLAFNDFNGATGIFVASNQGAVGALFRHWGPISGQTTGLRALDDPNLQPWSAADNGLLVANMDWASAGGTALLTAGTLYLMKVPIRQPFTFTNVLFGITTVGLGASTGSFVGLYNSSGTLLTGSADIGATLVGTVGSKSIALTTPQVFSTTSANLFVWVAILQNLATTQVTLRSGSGNSTANPGLATAALRFAVNGTGLTALPASITPASNTSGTALTIAVAGT